MRVTVHALPSLLYWSVLSVLSLLFAAIFFGPAVYELSWEYPRSEPIRKALGFQASYRDIPHLGSRFVVTAVERDGVFSRAGIGPGDGMWCGNEEVICHPSRFYERLQQNLGKTFRIRMRNYYTPSIEREVQLTLPASWYENPNSAQQPTGARSSD